MSLSAETIESTRSISAFLEHDGFAVVPAMLTHEQLTATLSELNAISLSGAGTRRLLAESWCATLAVSIRSDLVDIGVLAASSVAIQCILFDKTPDKNWLVSLHQDLSIPVHARIAHPSLSGWSEKESETFVQPSIDVLDQMLAVRVHLDDCGVDNGPVRVVAGSHRGGRMSESAARELRDATGETPCLASRGDALLMRPLLLHASSKASVPTRRRVLHFVFGPEHLPYGLEWEYAV